LTIAETNYTIERTWGPNSLKLDGRIVAQETLDRLLNLTPEEFNYSVFASQFGQMFFDLTPSDKLAVFTDIMALENWTEYSKNATEKAKDLDRTIQGGQSSMDRTIGELEALASELLRNKKAHKEYEALVAKELDELEERHDTLCSQYDLLVDEVEELSKEASKQPKPESTKELEQQIDEFVTILKANDVKVGQLNTQQQMLEKELAKFDAVEDQCPYCNQAVSREHLEAEKRHLNGRIASIETLRKKLNKQYKKTSAEYEALEDGLEMIEGANSRKAKLQLEQEQKLATAEKQLAGLDEEILRQEQLISTARTKSNPHSELIAAAQKQQEKLTAKQKKLEETLAGWRRSLEGMQFWAKGFKDLRLFLVEEALTQLEVEINNNLLQLGLRDWSIKLDVERETAAGGVAKGFHVSVQSPYNSKPVPWAVWSGGESQRLRLAGTMGLADLILARKGIDCNVEIYDEPTAHLSQSGIEDLLDSLYHRAIEREKQIILVDHRSLQFGNFASTTTIVKDEGGSHVALA